MLILGRKVGDSILIGDGIRVVVIAADRGSVKLGIEAPSNVTILREEIVTDISAENKRAGAAAAQEWLEVIGGPRPDEPSAKADATPRRRAAE